MEDPEGPATARWGKRKKEKLKITTTFSVLKHIYNCYSPSSVINTFLQSSGVHSLTNDIAWSQIVHPKVHFVCLYLCALLPDWLLSPGFCSELPVRPTSSVCVSSGGRNKRQFDNFI